MGHLHDASQVESNLRKGSRQFSYILRGKYVEYIAKHMRCYYLVFNCQRIINLKVDEIFC